MISIVANATTMRLMDAPRDVQLEIHSLLSYFTEGAEHSQAYKACSWDGKSSFFDMKRQTCPAGFVPLVERRLNQINQPYLLRRVPLPEPLGQSMEICQQKTGFAFDPKYDYQQQAVKKLLEVGQMIGMLATGAGKSNVACMSYFRIGRPTLFVTTRAALAHQMRDTLQSLGETVGIVGDSVWEPNLKGFTVAMSQTLASRLKPFDEKAEDDKIRFEPAKDRDGNIKKDRKGNVALVKSAAYTAACISKKPNALKTYNESVKQRLLQLRADHKQKQDDAANFLLNFEFVILEEAHESSADGYYRVMNACKNAHYRLALTATPFVKDEEESNMRLMACAGPIGIKVTEKTLIDRGVLATPYFKYIDIDKPEGLSRSSTWHQAYEIGIATNHARNLRIVSEVKDAVSRGLPTLVLIIRKKHGQELLRLLEEAGIRAKFIFGETKTEDRKFALSQLKDGTIQVLIGSTVLDVGIDVPCLGMIVLAGGGKAETSLRQRIGRGLRAKKQGQNVAFIVDFVDHGNSILYSHSKQRRNIIENIEGFRENILPKNQNFNFSEFPIK